MKCEYEFCSLEKFCYLTGVKVKNTSILATPISKAQPQMENVRISAAVPDLKWLHNPACKIQTESQVCYSMQWFSRKFLQLKDYITNRQKLQVWLYVCNRHVLWRLISLPYETDLSGKSSMIRPLEVMCFFLYVLDYVNYQKLKLNFPEVIFRWHESLLESQRTIPWLTYFCLQKCCGIILSTNITLGWFWSFTLNYWIMF